MKLVYAILLALSIMAPVYGGDLDQPARQVLLDHLNKSSAEFRDSIKDLSAKQWNYKPGAGGWSAAECAEHIVLSEDLLRAMVEHKILTGAASPERIAERKTFDQKVLKMITDRSVKAKAPEPLQPNGQFTTPAAALKKFEESRKKTIALAKSRDDLREHAGPHPVLKELDAYQWLLYLSGHTLRHTAQIGEVKGSSGFPAGR